MVMTGDSSCFVDANVLVYANVAESPFHQPAFQAIKRHYEIGDELWVSRQVLREFLATLTRPKLFTNPRPISIVIERVQFFETSFRVAEDNPQVTARLLELIEQIAVGGRQVHDANIVATMLVYGVRRLLTHNVADFRRFSHLIDVEPLVV